MAPHGGGLEIWDLQALQPFLTVIAAVLLVWFSNMAVTGWLAGRKGRDDGLWTVVATFLGPVALIAVLVLPRRERRSEPAEIEAARARFSGTDWPTLPAPPAPITNRERLLGALLGAGLAATGTAFIAAVSNVGFAATLMVIAASAGGLVAHRLSGALIDADRNRLIAVGLAAGVLSMSVNALFTVAAGTVPALLAAESAGDLLWLALSGVLALVGALLYPVVTPVVAPGLLAVSLLGGVVWAGSSRFLILRTRPPRRPLDADRRREQSWRPTR